MAKLIKFPSIEQFRNVVKSVRDRAKFHEIPLPTLKFNGSVKLHGTNAAVVKDIYTGEIWMQSREQIITPEADNAGFARFMTENPALNVLMNIAAGVYGNHKFVAGDSIAVYGEWCGGNIQKSVALNQLPKMFVIFGIRVIPTCDENDERDHSYWFTPEQLIDVADGLGRETSDECKIFCIQKFPTFEVEIDFTRPDAIQNRLVELTTEVEKQCPVGKAFGADGIGEGIVWRCVSDWNFNTEINGENQDVTLVVPKIYTGDLVFKVKGQAHSVTKVKKLASVDTEKISQLNELIEKIMTSNRMQQMYDTMKDKTGLDPKDPKNFGDFIRICVADAIKEEQDTIIENGFEVKEFTKAVPTIVRQWFFSLNV